MRKGIEVHSWIGTSLADFQISGQEIRYPDWQNQMELKFFKLTHDLFLPRIFELKFIYLWFTTVTPVENLVVS
jgi:hypothetical protein